MEVLSHAVNSKLVGLDFLRALAISMITLYHMMPNIFVGGVVGVTIFFVMSGFLSTYNAERAGENFFHVGEYFLKRLKRIYPPLLVMLLVTCGVFSFWLPQSLQGIRDELISIVLGFNNWWQIGENAEYFTRVANNSPFTHLWFLGIEIEYYLIFPIIFLLYRLTVNLFGRTIGFFLMVLAAISTATLMPIMYTPDSVVRLYYGTDTRIFEFLIGAVAGIHLSNRGRLKTTGQSSDIIFIILSAALLAVFFMIEGTDEIMYQGGFVLVAVASMLLILNVVGRSKSSVLENPVCKFLSRHSYSIYLWQYPIIYFFAHVGITGAEAIVGEFLITIFMSVWTDDFVASVKNSRINLKPKFFFARFIVFCLVSLAGIGAMASGCYALTSPTISEDKGKMLSEIKSTLEKKAEMLNEQNPEQLASSTTELNLNGLVFIGDSVLLGASQDIKALFPNSYIDAQVSRYVMDGLPVAQSFAQQNLLGDTVVVGLGANGPMAWGERYEKPTLDFVNYLAASPTRKIFWVNCYAPNTQWQNDNNEYLRSLEQKYKNIFVVDWYTAASTHSEYLAGDLLHPNEIGSKIYAQLILDKIKEVANKNEN